MVRIGPDALELIASQDQNQKDRSQDETPDSRNQNRNESTNQDLSEMGLTREEFEALNTAFTDPAQIRSILKKVATANPQKVAQMLNRMFEYLMPATRDNIFKQMVDHNPVFNEQERQELKDL
jgi:hypothetical protein